MAWTKMIVVILLHLCHAFQYENDHKECICECCLDDSFNFIPTFRSAVNVNPFLDCNNTTCTQESCLTFSQCSLVFGYSLGFSFYFVQLCHFSFKLRKIIPSCRDLLKLPSLSWKITC